jgi:thymidylate synthase
MNKLDKQYQQLLQDIIDYGVEKKDRTGTGTKSIFGYTIRHKMSDGFPLLTTKKMAWKTMVTELLWFLRGDTNIKYLVDNNCHIWDGDAYKNYLKKHKDNLIGCTIVLSNGVSAEIIAQHNVNRNVLITDKGRINIEGDDTIKILNDTLTQEEFINKIKTDDEFAKKWGKLGPSYGKQWRSWTKFEDESIEHNEWYKSSESIDQISNLINDLKTNPDSRRLMVNAWNVSELDEMVLPPCHYGFQVYTRELSDEERLNWMKNNKSNVVLPMRDFNVEFSMDEWFRPYGVPKRAISLMFNMRSNDVPLGLPFNIASYALLLEIIGKIVNMVPDELIGNLGDCHIYLNQIEGVKEQIGRDYTLEERLSMVSEEIQKEFSSGIVNLPNFPNTPVWSDGGKMSCLDDFGVPRRTREPYPLPKLVMSNQVNFNEGIDEFLNSCLIMDFKIEGYQSHPTIKIPLSN